MLSDKVKELEAAYYRLHWLTGSLIATLIEPRNQNSIYEGRGLDTLYGEVERIRNEIKALPVPEEPAGSAVIKK